MLRQGTDLVEAAAEYALGRHNKVGPLVENVGRRKWLEMAHMLGFVRSSHHVLFSRGH